LAGATKRHEVRERQGNQNMSEVVESGSAPVRDRADTNPRRSSIFATMFVALGVGATLIWIAFLVWLAIRIL
jgi:hypothetical protein